jgi:hypothetical protein
MPRADKTTTLRGLAAAVLTPWYPRPMSYLSFDANREPLKAKTTRAGLGRFQALVDAVATGSSLQRVVLRVYETQSQALFEASGWEVSLVDGYDAATTRAALDIRVPPLAGEAAAQIGLGELRTHAGGATGDLWCTEWSTHAGAEGFDATWRAMVAFAAERDALDPIPTSWSDRENPKGWTHPLSLSLHWDMRWTEPGPGPDAGTRLPTPWDDRNRAFLELGPKPYFHGDLCLPFEEFTPGFLAFYDAASAALGRKLTASRIKWRFGHGGDGANSWDTHAARFKRAEHP